MTSELECFLNFVFNLFFSDKQQKFWELLCVSLIIAKRTRFFKNRRGFKPKSFVRWTKDVETLKYKTYNRTKHYNTSDIT